MDFIKEELANMIGGGMGDVSMVMWIVIAVVLVVVVAGVAHYAELLGCHTGRVSVDSKCINMCPVDYVYVSKDPNNSKNVICNATGDKALKGKDGIGYTFPVPTSGVAATYDAKYLAANLVPAPASK